MKNLVPELRTDKNGKQTTRWVTPESTGELRCTMPSPAAPVCNQVASLSENRATALAGVAQRDNAWFDDKIEIETAFEAADAGLLTVFANVAHSDHRLRAVKRTYELMEQHSCKDIDETLTAENLGNYNIFIGILNQRAATHGDLRVQSLRVHYLEAPREDQLIIERIMDARRTTELSEVKALVSEFKRIEPAISSGVL